MENEKKEEQQSEQKNDSQNEQSEKKELEQSNVPIDPKDMARIRAQIGQNKKTDTYILVGEIINIQTEEN